MKIVVATKNNHKVSELKEMLNMPSVEFFTMSDFNLDIDIVEDGTTFEENAMIKAKAVYNALHDETLMVIADDSGLCVDALDGAPGIYSARYSGKGDKENNLKLLEALKDVPPLKRTGRFICSIALVSHNHEKIFNGKCEGLIDKEERGENDFGYDPLFYYPAFSKTFGEMTHEEKNKVSHRANAVKLLKDFLNSI